MKNRKKRSGKHRDGTKEMTAGRAQRRAEKFARRQLRLPSANAVDAAALSSGTRWLVLVRIESICEFALFVDRERGEVDPTPHSARMFYGLSRRTPPSGLVAV